MLLSRTITCKGFPLSDKLAVTDRPRRHRTCNCNAQRKSAPRGSALRVPTRGGRMSRGCLINVGSEVLFLKPHCPSPNVAVLPLIWLDPDLANHIVRSPPVGHYGPGGSRIRLKSDATLFTSSAQFRGLSRTGS